jgi:glucose-specific phosphotransferase system IIA component
MTAERINDMFQKNKNRLLAPASGKAITLESVPDEVFSSKMLGEGFAVEPETGVFFSPSDGVIESVSETLHAYTLRTNEGLDVLVHIGIDTVDLKGEGFSSCVEVGDKVRAGDVIARADIALIRSKGFLTVTPVIVSNPEKLSSFELNLGEAIGGETAVMNYKL